MRDKLHERQKSVMKYLKKLFEIKKAIGKVEW